MLPLSSCVSLLFLLIKVWKEEMWSQCIFSSDSESLAKSRDTDLTYRHQVHGGEYLYARLDKISISGAPHVAAINQSSITTPHLLPGFNCSSFPGWNLGLNDSKMTLIACCQECLAHFPLWLLVKKNIPSPPPSKHHAPLLPKVNCARDAGRHGRWYVNGK